MWLWWCQEEGNIGDQKDENDGDLQYYSHLGVEMQGGKIQREEKKDDGEKRDGFLHDLPCGKLRREVGHGERHNQKESEWVVTLC